MRSPKMAAYGLEALAMSAPGSKRKMTGAPALVICKAVLGG